MIHVISPYTRPLSGFVHIRKPDVRTLNLDRTKKFSIIVALLNDVV